MAERLSIRIQILGIDNVFLGSSTVTYEDYYRNNRDDSFKAIEG